MMGSPDRTLLPLWPSQPESSPQKRKFAALVFPGSSSPLRRPTSITNNGDSHGHGDDDILFSAALTGQPGLPSPMRLLSPVSPPTKILTAEWQADWTITVGRSSRACSVPVPTSRLISRLHVETRFFPASAGGDAAGGDVGSVIQGTVSIKCLGWNGADISCRARRWRLRKGKDVDLTWTDCAGGNIVVDIPGVRVNIPWPVTVKPEPEAEPALAEPEERPVHEHVKDEVEESAELPARSRSPSRSMVPSSPPIGLIDLVPTDQDKMRDPVSEADIATDPLSPFDLPSSPPVSPLSSVSDGPDDLDEDDVGLTLLPDDEFSTVVATIPDVFDDDSSHHSIIPTIEPHDNDQPNDDQPDDSLVHRSPKRVRTSPHAELPTVEIAIPSTAESDSDEPLSPIPSTPPPSFPSVAESPIRNHTINQLAFGRAKSVPSATLLANLPPDIAVGLSPDHFLHLVRQTDCIGEVERHGRDAAGKPLENEFYYIADLDDSEVRRAAAGSEGRHGLRGVRRTHKQYFWKRPRA